MIHYTRHAQQRMQQRGITTQEVEDCLAQPDITYPDGNGNVNVIRGSLRVVVTADRKQVITVVRK
ncbi:MAG: hypothetical protein C7B46_16485 [Sulfobacillus benefaciens]|uniref:DUF4258 domain-containing protein n=1 Tax=Sulfobacillus benefaciens TaxID=453960 RepID=A0A2T2XAW0_9FIRM|nr:MAG: hypothetical protein C7B46_16485 [Sulfobacillus benefaciens]